MNRSTCGTCGVSPCLHVCHGFRYRQVILDVCTAETGIDTVWATPPPPPLPTPHLPSLISQRHQSMHASGPQFHHGTMLHTYCPDFLRHNIKDSWNICLTVALTSTNELFSGKDPPVSCGCPLSRSLEHQVTQISPKSRV